MDGAAGFAESRPSRLCNQRHFFHQPRIEWIDRDVPAFWDFVPPTQFNYVIDGVIAEKPRRFIERHRSPLAETYG